jgi:hypothetical protein
MTDKVWVLVETIQSYRLRYMVEAPATNPEYALDDVTMRTPKEFSQLALQEIISSHRVISEEDAMQLCEDDNEYVRGWTNEKLMKAFFTKTGERNDY